MYPFGELDLPSCVPAGPIHHQQDVLVLSGSHLFGELIERHREQLHVDRGQDQPVHLSALGPHETVEVGPLVSPLEEGYGSLSHRCPHPPHHQLQTQPSFILGPEFDPRPRISLPDLFQPLGKTTLKASRSSESAPWAFSRAWVPEGSSPLFSGTPSPVGRAPSESLSSA